MKVRTAAPLSTCRYKALESPAAGKSLRREQLNINLLLCTSLAISFKSYTLKPPVPTIAETGVWFYFETFTECAVHRANIFTSMN